MSSSYPRLSGTDLRDDRYVNSYSSCGSTTSSSVVRVYIKALADGREDDTQSWCGFDVRTSQTIPGRWPEENSRTGWGAII